MPAQGWIERKSAFDEGRSLIYLACDIGKSLSRIAKCQGVVSPDASRTSRYAHCLRNNRPTIPRCSYILAFDQAASYGAAVRARKVRGDFNRLHEQRPPLALASQYGRWLDPHQPHVQPHA